MAMMYNIFSNYIQSSRYSIFNLPDVGDVAEKAIKVKYSTKKTPHALSKIYSDTCDTRNFDI